jgi:hypothetical protein
LPVAPLSTPLFMLLIAIMLADFLLFNLLLMLVAADGIEPANFSYHVVR